MATGIDSAKSGDVSVKKQASRPVQRHLVGRCRGFGAQCRGSWRSGPSRVDACTTRGAAAAGTQGRRLVLALPRNAQGRAGTRALGPAAALHPCAWATACCARWRGHEGAGQPRCRGPRALSYMGGDVMFCPVDLTWPRRCTTRGELGRCAAGRGGEARASNGGEVVGVRPSFFL